MEDKIRTLKGFNNNKLAMSTYTQILYQIVFATKNQKDHHKKVSFRDEYISLLKEHGIEFDEKYLF